AAFAYNWTTEDGNIVEGATTLTPTVDAAGMYVLEESDEVYDCVSMDTTIVTEDDDVPVAMVAHPDAINCINSTVTLDGSGSSSGANYTYLWTTQDGNIVSGETTNMAVVDAGGTYTLSVTNTENGCISTSSQTVEEDTNTPVYTTAGATLTCNAPSGELCVMVSTPFDSVVWSGNGQNGTCLTVNEGGEYEFTVYGSNGCTSTGSTTAEDQTALPSVSVSTPQSLGCGVTSVELDASASSSGAEFSYTWTTTNGHFVSGTDDNVATVDQAGLYTFTVTNNNTGCTSSASVEVFDGAQAPDASFTYSVDYNVVTVYGNPLQGAYTSTWEYDGNTVSGDTATFSFNDNGDYEICHYQENNCGIDTSCSTISITAIQPLSYSENIVNVSCNGESDGSISIVGSGGVGELSIVWTGPNGFASSDFEISGLSAGNYSMTMVDEGNHSIAGDFTITEPDPISVQSSITNETSTTNDGSIDLTVTGGTPPYTFSWSNGSTEEDPKDLTKGEYTVTITDANGCTYTETFSVGTTGINDPDFVENFELFPNPAGTQTKVSFKFTENISGNLKIIDFTGKVVKSYNVAGQDMVLKLDISDMQSGIYMIKLESKNKIAVRKLIKI
ncbi:MAG TPA: T9SS type A sorting domain-containing protein, partial [Bacteroidetes bacterium]|nr:T9SS type A sorting domain-containing protein [Bacteroidota bacterium]